MPLYCYRCKKNDFEVEVLRSFNEYEVPPSQEEIPAEHRGKEYEWDRVIYTAPAVIKAPGFGSKGNW